MRLPFLSRSGHLDTWNDRKTGRGMRRRPYRSRLGILLICIGLTACAVQEKREAVTYDVIPANEAPSAEDTAFGRRIMRYMLDDHPGDPDGAYQTRLDETFSQLAEAAGLDPEAWHVRLLHAPGIADARSVEGNYLFVWSGLFDVIENDDELAGLLACEMAHLLAGHTEPVQFTFASELLFGLADAALTVGSSMLSQGVLNVSGVGITRSIFIDVNDLDPVDRVYTPEQLNEMADIATLILEASRYSPDGLVAFWRRADDPESTPEALERLVREIPPADRLAILEAALLDRGLAPENGAIYADEPMQTGDPDEIPPDLGSNGPESDQLPEPTG